MIKVDQKEPERIPLYAVVKVVARDSHYIGSMKVCDDRYGVVVKTRLNDTSRENIYFVLFSDLPNCGFKKGSGWNAFWFKQPSLSMMEVPPEDAFDLSVAAKKFLASREGWEMIMRFSI